MKRHVNRNVAEYVARSNKEQNRLLRIKPEQRQAEQEMKMRKADFTPNYQYELFQEEKTFVFRPWNILALILAISLIVILLSTSRSIGEEPQVQSLQGLICNTPEQVEAVMSPLDHSKALAEVNTPEAVCLVFLYAGIIGNTMKTIDTPEGKTDIKAIAVIAISPDGVKWVQLQEPQLQYAPFLQKPKPVGVQA